MKNARVKGVDVREHNIIYKLVDDIKEELTQRLVLEEVEHELGQYLVSYQSFFISLLLFNTNMVLMRK